ncbi:MFS transporter [Agromyces sp. NPDC058484]|uniref:MFS transporter n=1 Tax=Agromyces sp. NPDC058484 TaxID=3346524 RepID=UPI00366206AC
MVTSRNERRERLTVLVLAASGMLTSLQFTLIVPALPEIPSMLGVSANDASWMVTVTLLTGTVGTPVVTRLADMYGRRRMLLVSLGLLAAGSVIAAMGMTFTTVLIGRALQGFATAIVPIGVSLLRGLTSRERSNVGIALMSGTLGIGSALGLPLSGVLVTWGGLAALFWFSAAAGAIFVALVAMVVSEVPSRKGGRFDLVGSVLLGVALTCVLLVVSKIVVWGAWSPGIIVLVVTALLAFAVWFPFELRHPNPVIDVRTSLRRPVLQTNVASFFAAFGMFANHLLTMQEARASEGAGLALPVLGAGLILVPSAVAMVALAPVAGALLNRLGGRVTLALGTATITAAFVFRLLVHDGIVAVVIGALIVGVGTAFAFAAMPSLIMDAVPEHEAASANGVNSLTRSLSGAMASAVFAFLIAALPVQPGGDFLSEQGFMIAFGLTAAFGAVGTVLALTLPERPFEAAPDAA